jgi:Protein of unknown function (DUF2281)
MSTWAFYSKIERLPDHLKQQVLDYIEFLISREAKSEQSMQKQEQTNNPESKQVKSRFAGRISPETTAQLHQQLKEMREEWH